MKQLIIAATIMFLMACTKTTVTPAPPPPPQYTVVVTWTDTINKSKLTGCDSSGFHYTTIKNNKGLPMNFAAGSDTLIYTKGDKCFCWNGGKMSSTLTKPFYIHLKINNTQVFSDSSMLAGGQIIERTMLDHYISVNGL